MAHSYRVRIGHKEIVAMEPNTLLWDVEVKGFCARRQFSEIVTYSVIFRNREGRQHWYKLGRHPILTPKIARCEAIRVLRAVTLGEDPSDARKTLRHSITMAALCDEYLVDMQSGKVNGKKTSTIKSDISRIAIHIKPALGKLKVVSVTQADIESFVQSLSPGNARRVLGLTGAIFSWAIRKKLRETNPCRGVETPKDNRRLRRLSVAEYAQLGRALDGHNVARDVFMFLAVSGWRSGEARLLKYSELDLDRRIATLGDTKSGQSVRPLSGAAIEIIQRQPLTDSEYVFALQQGAPINKLFHHWERLGMPKDVTPHSLRHSLASLAADLGLADHTIARLLGHIQKSITSRYIHMERALIEASDLVANETLRLMRS
jgi:integrase